MATRRFTLAILILAGVSMQSACAQNARRSEGPEEEIRYVYRLTINNQSKLCGHTRQVFNDKFQRIWVREPLPLADESSPYGPNGKFAFPKAAGVQHDTRKTFEMALSRLPSSSEFDAIPWRETRATMGGPAGTPPSPGDTPQAALITYLDFDNDGQPDRIVKYGFTEGYEALRDRNEWSEYLAVWRGERADMPAGSPMWSLLRDATGVVRGIFENGQYLRPFRYSNRTYVAKYEMHFDESVPGFAGRREITSETMTILEFRDAGGRVEGTGMLRWSDTTLCEYELVQV